MSEKKNASLQKAGSGAVDAFLGKVAGLTRVDAAGGRGRLLFAMDATASRQPTWAQARDIQSEMFSAAAGNLEVQLGFYRGRDEFKVSKWLTQSRAPATRHAARSIAWAATPRSPACCATPPSSIASSAIHAVVFIGDAVEEPVDELCHLAGELGLLGLPLFIFHEGGNARP